MTIVDFLLTRLKEEEVAAVAARDADDGRPSHRWEYSPEDREFDFGRPNRAFTLDPERTPALHAELAHAAHYNPVRILREIAAKRRIVQVCAAAGPEGTGAADLAEAVLDQLAALYQSHPDYLSWKTS